MDEPVVIEFLTRADEYFIRERVANILKRNTTEDSLSDRLDDLTTFDQGSRLDSINSPAVEFADDHV